VSLRNNRILPILAKMTDLERAAVTPPDTGKMTPSAIIFMIFGGLVEFWIVFTLTFAALTRTDGRGYLTRVGDALRFQLR
jgi:hypothetical protein